MAEAAVVGGVDGVMGIDKHQMMPLLSDTPQIEPDNHLIVVWISEIAAIEKILDEVRIG